MKNLIVEAERLQEILISRATGGGGDESEFQRLRQTFLSATALDGVLPSFIRKYRSLHQYWEFIKHKFGTYHQRRTFIWDEFRDLIEVLERGGIYPIDLAASARLENFDASSVHAVWSKALERRTVDPEGAITIARTLLETVCKHILDEVNANYSESADLPRLYGMASKELKLAPSQHTEQVFRQILGGCTAVVEGLGSLRNRLSDAHGRGKLPARPAPRHAELAVNLAGTMASYLVATMEARLEGQATRQCNKDPE